MGSHSADKELKVLIVGMGSIGRRHLANLRKLLPSAHIISLHHRKPQDEALLPVEVDTVVYQLPEALATKPEIALITNPAPFHLEMGLALAQQGVHLFIEKPLAHTLAGVDDLIALCHQQAVVLMVGYNFRFCRSLQSVRQAILAGKIGRVMSIRAEVGQFLPDWRPGSDYRQGVSARRDLGGGVVLELSHELDYTRWLMGEVKTVSASTARLSELELDVEDTAEIILQFQNGALGSIHLDMTQRPPLRLCRIIGTQGTLTWNGLTHQAQLFSAATNAWSDLQPTPITPDEDMYLAELRHFLKCVKENQPPDVSGEDGRRVLEIALAVKQSAQEERMIRL